MRFDEKKDDVTVPKYQIGCPRQKRLAQTKNGSLPLFLGVKD